MPSSLYLMYVVIKVVLFCVQVWDADEIYCCSRDRRCIPPHRSGSGLAANPPLLSLSVRVIEKLLYP